MSRRTLRQAQGERKEELDAAKLEARARGAGDAAARRALDRIEVAIGATYPQLDLEREVARLRVSGAGLSGLARSDVRLRLPEEWLDDGGAR